jgi:glycine/D-amino acid oxidase-like deaminating enzyme
MVSEGTEVYLVDNNGEKLGEGTITDVQLKPNKTNVIKVHAPSMPADQLLAVRGTIAKRSYPEPLVYMPRSENVEAVKYICHCDDVTFEEVLEVIGDRKFISIDEIKHTTRLGMGACRGKRCIMRIKPLLAAKGIQLVGTPTPRAPLSNQLTLGDLYLKDARDEIDVTVNSPTAREIETELLIAGGGIGGSALFRYFAEAGKKPLLINYDRGSSWRNIAGGRPAFSIPELCEIANENKAIFEKLQEIRNIDYHETNYVTFAHDDTMYDALEASQAWSDAVMIEPKDFQRYISPYINPDTKIYQAALITRNCWQASPGKVVDVIRTVGVEGGGTVMEDCRLIDVERDGDRYTAIMRDHTGEYIICRADHFINALGANAAPFAERLNIHTGLYPVKHQAFITRRMPMMGIDGAPLGMLIDRRCYKGFIAAYGQQLYETGQIIGCASPEIEPLETERNLKINARNFLEIISEVFVNWVPALSSVEFQAVWAGYYIEPRMIIDPERGLFVGLRGQGFMLAQHLAKLYVDAFLGKQVPQYFERLSLDGDGLPEKEFK